MDALKQFRVELRESVRKILELRAVLQEQVTQAFRDIGAFGLEPSAILFDIIVDCSGHVLGIRGHGRQSAAG